MEKGKWGGKRNGAGRKALQVQKKPYTKRLTPDEKEYLDKCLDEYRAARSDQVAND